MRPFEIPSRIFELALKGVPNCRDFPLHGENLEDCPYRLLNFKHQPIWDLKRYLSIPKRLIFASSVESGMPSLEAAPAGPDTRP